MILGIGVDTVNILEIQRFMEDGGPFLHHTFTDEERAAAEQRSYPAEYFAGRFAAKEAVFKALAPLTHRKAFDLRIVETLNRSDGSPYISISEQLQKVLSETGVSRLHISITAEDTYATAFVIAE